MSVVARSDQTSPTLWERFERAAATPGQVAVVGEGTESMSTLFERAAHGGAGLAGRGLGPGSRVAALATTSFDFMVAALSTWAAGATFVSLPPPPVIGDTAHWREGLSTRIAAARVDALLLGAQDDPLRLGATELSIAGIGETSGALVEVVDPASPALIQFSSGSTRAPKGVVLSHRALVAQFDAISDRSRRESENHILSWLPLFHDLGLIRCLLWPLSRGDDVTLIPTSAFLRDPLMWLREISERRATHSFSPNFAYGLIAKLLEAEPEQDLDLTSWGYASCGGEMIHAPTLERFVEAAEPFGFPPSSLVPGYGLAEATCVVSATLPGRGMKVDIVDRDALGEGRAVPCEPSERAATFVSTGPPLRGCRVAILRDGRKVGEREVGEILVSAPQIMEGYVDDPEATERAFWNGWLRTGDLGYVFEGEIYPTGRSKDLLIVRGRNLHPEDVERMVVGVPGMRPGTAVAVADQEGTADEGILIVAETELPSGPEREEVRREIVRRVWRGTGLNPSVILASFGSVPKTSSGKLQRHEAHARVSDGRIGEAP